MKVILKEHQAKALKEMSNGCILRGGVGSGKSFTGLFYFYINVCGGKVAQDGSGEMELPDRPRDIYVITTKKKRDDLDWEKDALNFNISTKRELSQSGIQLKVDSWNNIPKYEGIKDAFFIFDEQRLVGSGAWVKAFLKIAAANQWIMLSATPGDIWLDYCPVFLAHGFYRNRTDFIRSHVVYSNFSKFPKVERYVETGRLERLRRRITVEMPFNRATTRHVQDVPVAYDKEAFEKVVKHRWHIYEDRPIKDVAEMFRVMRKLVNSDVSRLGEVHAIWEKHPRLIIFYNFNYELEMLRTLHILGVPVAEWNGKKHEPVPEGDKWIYLVQYTAGAEGWNCITTNAMIFFSLNYSYKINEQAKGRIDRLNNIYFDLYYYILKSSSGIDNAIAKSLAHKRNFNEKEVIKKWEHRDTNSVRKSAA